MDNILNNGEHECNDCGHIFETFTHCGRCGKTRMIKRVKIGRFGHHLESYLDDYEDPRKNKRSAALKCAGVLIIIAAVVVAVIST